MKKLSLAFVFLFGCSTPEPEPAPPMPLHAMAHCERWRAENGKWYVAHVVNEESYYRDGPCPCGMTTDKAGHLYINGILSDDAQEDPPVSISPVTTR